MPSRLILAPLAVAYTMLTLVCGIEATAIVSVIASVFAIATRAFVVNGRASTAASRDRIVLDTGQP